MVNSRPAISLPIKTPLKVWVLAPTVPHTDEHINYYYDFSQSIAEYEKVFSAMQLAWHWQEVSMQDFRDVIDRIVEEKNFGEVMPVVLNLCDGDEINGTPGISVLTLLNEKGLLYTGSEENFYKITTSKIDMKCAFDKAGVATPLWKPLDLAATDHHSLFSALGSPLIVKPAISGGSMGVGTRNVVDNIQGLNQLVQTLTDGYRGWDLLTGGLIAESFIEGPEYTCFLTGDFRHPAGARIYQPVERVFHHSLPDREKFLSFDRLWEIYEEESAMPADENFYEYAAVKDPALCDAIKELSWQAYTALEGTGYTRVDIRQDRSSGKLYVLEANAQCGISEDENYTSIGAILRLDGCSFTELVQSLINNALARPNINKKEMTQALSEHD
jgi:D-alanine-D-alanine ligase